MASFKVRISITQEYSHQIDHLDTEEDARKVALRTPVPTIMRLWTAVGSGKVNGVLALKEVDT